MYSTFIEENYVDPKDVEITFEDKKNLIYIYLESIEISFSDKVNGGVFEHNLIPNLTRLSHDFLDFSGNTGKLNGPFSLPYTDWTIAAIFSLHSGLPLKIGNLNRMNQMNHYQYFFPNIICLGDILQEFDYNQVMLMGSESEFAGRNNFFKEHGDYNIIDYNFMKRHHLVDDDYFVFWGAEDYKLFEVAKSELLKLSKENKPFHLSLLTVDTHYPDGFLSEFCTDYFRKEQYKNVIYCSDSQLIKFIDWITIQDFYKNSVIVVTGDHPTMKSHFVITDGGYKRKNYASFVNTGINDIYFREYSSFDFFPTVLSAIGAKIHGEKLGLGVNLFSNEKTLIEKFGFDFVKKELDKPSLFIENRLNLSNQLKISDADESVTVMKSIKKSLKVKDGYSYYDSQIYSTDYNNDSITLNVDISNLKWKELNNDLLKYINDVEDMYISFYTDNDLNYKQIKMIRLNDHKFKVKIDNVNLDTVYFVNIIIKPKKYKSPKDFVSIGKLVGNLHLKTNNIDQYLERLNTGRYVIFISVRGDASSSITDLNIRNLKKFGLAADMQELLNYSYLAVIDGDMIYENYSKDKIEYKGYIKTNKIISYNISSAGLFSGDNSSIIINSDDYSINRRGLNFVIFDNNLQQVVDIANFDTSSGDFSHVR